MVCTNPLFRASAQAEAFFLFVVPRMGWCARIDGTKDLLDTMAVGIQISMPDTFSGCCAWFMLKMLSVYTKGRLFRGGPFVITTECDGFRFLTCIFIVFIV